ncbi:MAG: serine hydroxymethyltransferase [Phycisphaerales bacterium]|nr:serine hydroxymethyltransferase [Phycisphaerales bacterium]
MILKKSDADVFNLVQLELKRQQNGVELIASENFTSIAVMEAVGSVLTNKYAEGYPNRRYYGGCEVVDQVEQLAIDRLKKIFPIAYANVQPHSGSQANAALLFAILKPGDAILGMDLSMGGHLTHGSPVNFSGNTYRSHFYRVDSETGLIDYNYVAEQAKKIKPQVIVCGASAYSRDIDYIAFRNIADSVGAFLWADIAHPAGLIAKKLLNDPFAHCHFVTSTTHKTLRGPRGGIIMMGKDFENPWGRKDTKGKVTMMSYILDMAIFPGTQGGPLEHVIAGKAVAFGEILTPAFEIYAKQIIKNAQAMAQSFINMGYKVVSNGTDNHLLLLDLRSKQLTGKEAEAILQKIDITTNKNMVPYDTQSPFITSGIRIGTPAITTRGLQEKDMPFITEKIDQALSHHSDDKRLEDIKKSIHDFMRQFPLYPEL